MKFRKVSTGGNLFRTFNCAEKNRSYRIKIDACTPVFLLLEFLLELKIEISKIGIKVLKSGTNNVHLGH